MSEDDVTIGNGHDLGGSFETARSRNRDKSSKKSQARKTPAPGDRHKRTERLESPVNSIEARRRPKKDRPIRTVASPEGAAPPSQPDPALPEESTARGESDPWTVPQSVRDRFVQDGHRFYFPDGKEAFKDRGRRLTTASENTQVIHSLIDIAHSRGWTEVTVSGTERFRQEAWRQARIAGLAVRGYKPTEAEQVQVIRAIGRQLPAPAGISADSLSLDAQSAPDRGPAGAPSIEPRSDGAARSAPKERIVGKLVEFGRDAYRHDPREDDSYFVRVQTRSGEREIWGKDLERAIKQSLTQPQVGDEIILQQTGREVVTVNRAERDATGELKGKAVDTYRNRWVLEKETFFAERAHAAQLVRDSSIEARAAVHERPELAGTYLNLRAAELAARRLRDPEDRKRFVAQVRSALADGIERGEPLQPVRLRERRRVAPLRDRGDRTPESSLARG